jgi:hypothetical protein
VSIGPSVTPLRRDPSGQKLYVMFVPQMLPLADPLVFVPL